MPYSEVSVNLTAAYRERVETLRRTPQAVARLLWGRISRDHPDLDAEHAQLLATLSPAVVVAQTQAVQASAGYLTAFVTSELGRPVETATGDGSYVGSDRYGRPVGDALGSSLIAVKASLKRGRSLERALQDGLTRAERMVWLAVDHAARQCLQDAMHAEPRVTGYQRAVKGTCGACLGAASGTFGTDEDFEIHPGCQCVASPRVSGVRNRFPVPTGALIFAAMTTAQQDEAVGAAAAEAVRAGNIELSDLVAVAKQKRGPDFITQAAA